MEFASGIANFAPVFQSITSFCAVLALCFTAYSLHTNHDWNRRQAAAKMIEDWNPRTSVHRATIERIMPGLLDPRQGQQNELTLGRATAIYNSRADNPEQVDDWELRFAFIELLNYFEFIAASYLNYTCDQRMIEDSFKNTYLDYHRILRNFIDTFGKQKGMTGKPWLPNHALLKMWDPPADLRRRGSTGWPLVTSGARVK